MENAIKLGGLITPSLCSPGVASAIGGHIDHGVHMVGKFGSHAIGMAGDFGSDAVDHIESDSLG